MNKLVHIGRDKFNLNCVECNSDKVEITLFTFSEGDIKLNIYCTNCSNVLNVILPFYDEKDLSK